MLRMIRIICDNKDLGNLLLILYFIDVNRFNINIFGTLASFLKKENTKINLKIGENWSTPAPMKVCCYILYIFGAGSIRRCRSNHHRHDFRT